MENAMQQHGAQQQEFISSLIEKHIKEINELENKWQQEIDSTKAQQRKEFTEFVMNLYNTHKTHLKSEYTIRCLLLSQSLILSFIFCPFLSFSVSTYTSLFTNFFILCLNAASTELNNLISTVQTNESDSTPTENFKSLASPSSTMSTTDLISKDYLNPQRAFSSQNQHLLSNRSADSSLSTSPKTSKLPIGLNYLDPQHTEVFTVYVGCQLKIPYNFVLWSGDILSLCKYVSLSSSPS
jgi:hypothetical protein